MSSINDTPRVPGQLFEDVGPAGPVFVRTRCKSCGADIVWGVNKATGKKIPLNASPQGLYAVRVSNGQTVCVPVRDYVKMKGDADVSILTNHFLTCPNADRHRSNTR